MGDAAGLQAIAGQNEGGASRAVPARWRSRSGPAGRRSRWDGEREWSSKRLGGCRGRLGVGSGGVCEFRPAWNRDRRRFPVPCLGVYPAGSDPSIRLDHSAPAVRNVAPSLHAGSSSGTSTYPGGDKEQRHVRQRGSHGDRRHVSAQGQAWSRRLPGSGASRTTDGTAPLRSRRTQPRPRRGSPDDRAAPAEIRRQSATGGLSATPMSPGPQTEPGRVSDPDPSARRSPAAPRSGLGCL